MTAPNARVWERLFLAELAKCGSVLHAAAKAGIRRQTAYAARDLDPEFAERWLAAIDEALGSLEASALQRARDGSESLVVQSGKVVKHDDGTPVVERKFETQLTIFVTKTRLSRQYGEEWGEALSLGPMLNLDEVGRARAAITEAFNENRIGGGRFDRLLRAINARSTELLGEVLADDLAQRIASLEEKAV